MEIIPSIDLRDGKVVRLFKGDFNQQTDYEVDPVSVARSFAPPGEKLMHLVHLDGATAFWPDKLGLALDARDGIVATKGWTASSGQRAADLASSTSTWPLAA